MRISRVCSLAIVIGSAACGSDSKPSSSDGGSTPTGPTTNAINGGSTMITVEADSTIVKIYVAIQGEDGYWEVTVPAGTFDAFKV